MYQFIVFFLQGGAHRDIYIDYMESKNDSNDGLNILIFIVGFIVVLFVILSNYYIHKGENENKNKKT